MAINTDITVEFCIDAECRDCHESLSVEVTESFWQAGNEWFKLVVEPCPSCMEAATKAGYDDGYNEGYKDARREME